MEIFAELLNGIGVIIRLRKKPPVCFGQAGEVIPMFKRNPVEGADKIGYAIGPSGARGLPDRDRTDDTSAKVGAVIATSV